MFVGGTEVTTVATSAPIPPLVQYLNTPAMPWPYPPLTPQLARPLDFFPPLGGVQPYIGGVNVAPPAYPQHGGVAAPQGAPVDGVGPVGVPVDDVGAAHEVHPDDVPANEGLRRFRNNLPIHVHVVQDYGDRITERDLYVPADDEDEQANNGSPQKS